MKNILDDNINYIISGIERSGTSMLMQVISAGGIPIAFDLSRPRDEHNPRGYFELEGGKIINKLIEGTFSFDEYKGQFIKITAYGLKFLPKGNFKIIYIERNIEEILDSMEKMTGNKDINREETKQVFIKLNKMIKTIIKERDDIDVLFMNYNKILKEPDENLRELITFIGLEDDNLQKMVKAIDEKLYRQKRDEKITIHKNGL